MTVPAPGAELRLRVEPAREPALLLRDGPGAPASERSTSVAGVAGSVFAGSVFAGVGLNGAPLVASGGGN